MTLRELREAIKGLPGDAEIQVHVPGGPTLDVASITYKPADKASFADYDDTVNIWLESPGEPKP